MKNRNVSLGILFILIGVLWILENLNILNFQWKFLIIGLMDLWPLTLVVIGINILIKNKTVEKGIWILFFIILLGYSFFLQENAPIDIPNSTSFPNII